jgi:hypothetical protein
MPLSGIRTHDPSVRASENGSCLRPRGHCGRRKECNGRIKMSDSVGSTWYSSAGKYIFNYPFGPIPNCQFITLCVLRHKWGTRFTCWVAWLRKSSRVPTEICTACSCRRRTLFDKSLVLGDLSPGRWLIYVWWCCTLNFLKNLALFIDSLSDSKKTKL